MFWILGSFSPVASNLDNVANASHLGGYENVDCDLGHQVYWCGRVLLEHLH